MWTRFKKLIEKIVQNQSLILLFLLAMLLATSVVRKAFADVGNGSVSIECPIFFCVLPLKTEIDLVSIFSGTFIIIVLIERSIELLLPLFCSDLTAVQATAEAEAEAANTAVQATAEAEAEAEAEAAKANATVDTTTAALKKHKKDVAPFIGLVMGLFASIVGIRILEPLVETGGDITSLQLICFRFFDIVVSAMGIATGSELFHFVPSLTSSILGSVREQTEANLESAKTAKEASISERRSPKSNSSNGV